MCNLYIYIYINAQLEIKKFEKSNKINITIFNFG